MHHDSSKRKSQLLDLLLRVRGCGGCAPNRTLALDFVIHNGLGRRIFPIQFQTKPTTESKSTPRTNNCAQRRESAVQIRLLVPLDPLGVYHLKANVSPVVRVSCGHRSRIVRSGGVTFGVQSSLGGIRVPRSWSNCHAVP